MIKFAVSVAASESLFEATLVDAREEITWHIVICYRLRQMSRFEERYGPNTVSIDRQGTSAAPAHKAETAVLIELEQD